MALFKKKRSEKAVVYAILRDTLLEERTNWPTTYAALKEYCAEQLGKEFSVQDGLEEPWFDLAVAEIAMSLRQIENLYAADQAARIRAYLFQGIDDLGIAAGQAEYTKEEILAYERSFIQYATDFEATSGIPVGAVAARLLHRWLGEDLGVWETVIGETKTGMVSPLLVLFVETYLGTHGRVWKNVKDNYKLLPE